MRGRRIGRSVRAVDGPQAHHPASPRTSSFGFELDGARRTTDGNSYDQPLEVPDFVALGGDTPPKASGDGALEVVGNAYINRPTSSTVAVDLYGDSRLSPRWRGRS